MKKRNTGIKLYFNWVFFVIIFFSFIVFIGRLCYLSLVDFKIGDIGVHEFVENRNINSEVLLPNRGTIYDKDGNVLAQDVSSYTVIAYLSEKRSEGTDKIRHVQDKQMTAEKLSPLINMSVQDIMTLLNKEDLYQVELGPGGRNLSQLVMESIKDLELPGIDFIKSIKRYYPKGDFLSYTLGYVVQKEDEEENKYLLGEMGIEKFYNKYLSGEKGFATYEKDRYGYKIMNGRSYVEDAKDGNDIYLTVDMNIQLFVEEAVKNTLATSEAEWITITAMDAKTGEILGTSAAPSFDPNLRNMTSYLNPLVSYAYEPGSVMKVYTYMCAIESGKYKGDTIYKSGTKDYVDVFDKTKVTTIKDWNKVGWGDIDYDLGFALSSNIAVADMLETTITKDEMYDCFNKYGFGKKTDFTLSNELEGSIVFNYPIEAANAAFGQGITVTPIQHLQALTAISNNGNMLKPYIVSKVVDQNGDIIVSNKREVIDTIISSDTVSKMKELMHDVVNNDPSRGVGYMYMVDGYDVIGKTGTAQVYDYSTGKYFDSPNMIFSFSGMFPEADPKVIIFASYKHPKTGSVNYLADEIRTLITNIGKYLDVNDSNSQVNTTTYKIDNYLNKDVTEIKTLLESNSIKVSVIGNGNKIINQYPYKDTVINIGDQIFLITNGSDYSNLNLINLSSKEVINILNLLKYKYRLEGIGYVYEVRMEEDTWVIKLQE